MTTLITFKTAKFNTTEVKDYFINDICFGDDLSNWLFTKVKEKGLIAVEPWQEDWGWQFEVDNCSISIGFNGDEWQIYCEPILSFVQKLFGTKADNSGVFKVLKQILEDESEIMLIQDK